MSKKYRENKGFALVTTLLFVALMGLMLSAYHVATKFDLQSLKTSINYENSFFAAEAGLNARAEDFRQTFSFLAFPSGTSPNEENACTPGNMGSGDFACQDYTFGNMTSTTYGIQQFTGDPEEVVIPVGEAFGGLVAHEYKYDVISTSKNPTQEVGSILSLRFNSRVVPIFQFAAFYDKDLEITNVGDMLIAGPVFTNGNLYANVGSSADLVVNGQINVTGDIYHGRKRASSCSSGDIWVINGAGVEIVDPSDFSTFLNSTDFTSWNSNSDYACGSGGTRRSLADESFSEWNNNILQGVEEIEVPDIASTHPGAGNQYWDSADVRIVLNLDASDSIDTSYVASGIEVRTISNTRNDADTNIINNIANAYPLCDGAVISHDNTFWDQLRQSDITMLEVDVEKLLDCLEVYPNDPVGTSIVPLDDNTNGGHIIYLTVEGDNSDIANNYGIRIKNGDDLSGRSPSMNGLTIVTDQPVYLMGDFNTTVDGDGLRVSSSLYGDSLVVLSNAWENDNDFLGNNYDQNTQVAQINSSILWDDYMGIRDPSDTEINAALVFGTITTGGVEGEAGHDNAPNSAGLNNYMRLLEDWDRDRYEDPDLPSPPPQTLTVNGSFITLGQSVRAEALDRFGNDAGIDTDYHYTVPTRVFTFDESFNDPNNHPPGSLSFVYLRQVFFSRDFEQ